MGKKRRPVLISETATICRGSDLISTGPQPTQSDLIPPLPSHEKISPSLSRPQGFRQRELRGKRPPKHVRWHPCIPGAEITSHDLPRPDAGSIPVSVLWVPCKVRTIITESVDSILLAYTSHNVTFEKSCRSQSVVDLLTGLSIALLIQVARIAFHCDHVFFSNRRNPRRIFPLHSVLFTRCGNPLTSVSKASVKHQIHPPFNSILLRPGQSTKPLHRDAQIPGTKSPEGNPCQEPGLRISRGDGSGGEPWRLGADAQS